MSNGPAAALSPTQVFSLARNAGLGPGGAVIATAIAGAESGWDPDNVGDENLQDATWGPSIGLWQIRSRRDEYGKGTPRDASRLTDPSFNAQSMVAISGGGKNWRPWSTYTNGAYKKYLQKAAASVNGTVDFGPFGSVDVADAAKGAAAAINPFTGWAASAIKLLAGATAAALVVVGATRTVSSN